MSEYVFKRDEGKPATIGYGQAQRVIRRHDAVTVGFVRKLTDEFRARGSNWVVYRPDGSELGIADQRSTAANWLGREHAAVPPFRPAPQGGGES